LREDTAGLYMEARVSKTAPGDEVLELVRDGALDALSVGFQPVQDRQADDGTVERTEVKLREISVVTMGAYEGAAISGVRSGDQLTSEASAQLDAYEHVVADLAGLERDYVRIRAAAGKPGNIESGDGAGGGPTLVQRTDPCADEMPHGPDAPMQLRSRALTAN